MKLIHEYTENPEQFPTRMGSICGELIGEEVAIYTNGGHALFGKLVDFNSDIIHLINNAPSTMDITNIYILRDMVVAVRGNK